METVLEDMPATVAGLPLGGTGLSLAELQMTTPEQRELAVVSAAAPKPHRNTPPGDSHLQFFAVSEGASGNSSSGSEGSGAQTAETAGDWDRTPLRAGARVFDPAQDLPASPASDPGCSPD